MKQLNSLPVDIRWRAEDRLHVAFHRERHTSLSRLELFFMLIGPGILVMIADNDAGGVITYAQTGAIFGI
ncbi:MAG: divalent metal cation transporter, partial [Thermoplasmata archaeon]|nr:divalent metal cation transporter [Candidatus Sysuiplasma superficiale]